MKGTKDKILLSLDGLNGDQMSEVLNYIQGMLRIKGINGHQDLKEQALKEIQQALKPSNQLA